MPPLDLSRLTSSWLIFSWLVLPGLLLGCGSTAPLRPASGAAGLDEGPTRWLMLPEEEKQYRRLRTSREVIDFVEAFWLRRDPDPNRPGNAFARAFNERVEAADRLYGEEGTRGSLTDRGRALVLLGPPPVLRYSQKKVPAWEPGHPGSPSAVQTRSLPLESWVYTVAELPPALQQLLQQDDPRPEIVLVFVVNPEHTSLMDGEKYLKMAAKAAIRQ
jgi:GWxTD domain-containing protein